MNTQLTVYKASAGSGKTFTLAREYMTLLIDNPAAYRTILAVTFTNKATEEMKIRILRQLYGLAHGLDESKDYMRQIHESLPHLSEAQIAKNAAISLSLLIHNYNYFRVQTIDTFFQSVLRNLARELDLTANLRIGLNDRQVVQQAVDELIEGLSTTDKLLLWIMEYIKDNIADDKAWNVIGQIKQFGEHIFKDYYKDNATKLNECIDQEGFFKSFIAKMKKMRNDSKEKLTEVAETFFDALEENGYTADDLAGKTRGIWSYFNKLKQGKFSDEDLINSTFSKCYEKPEAWVKKSEGKPGNPLYDLVASTLYPMLRFSESNRPQWVHLCKSADLTIRHLSQLRLLSSIDKKVRELNQEANRFLLSDTQTLLHSLIQESDSPFIFEKIGTQLEHVMIDEFQDTSTIQWKNFKVLLEETMSHENPKNLIVGDVKQSIYRWRSGDWRLLNNIADQFPMGSKQLSIKTLDTNWRSDRNIISFNNAFFISASRREYEQLKEDTPEAAKELLHAYEDVTQKVPAKKGKDGYVKVQLIATENWQDRMMELTLQMVDELINQGVAYHQIAILVRSNKTIQDIAEYIMDHRDYPLVSDEAFRLDASQAVNTLITALHFLTHPNDDIAQAVLNQFCSDYLDEAPLVEHLKEKRNELLRLPLQELTEHLYSCLNLGEIDEMEQQSAYVCAFFDQLNSYLTDNGSDIDAFLAEWDSNIHEKSIHSDAIDGIRLITIHKSKGLEFDHVIMPFCDWTLEKSNTIWCTPTEEPFCALPLVPVDFNAKQMKGSTYEADYFQEHLQNMVDNLNLLYVAFTRASHGLYVLGRRGSALLRSAIIEQSLPDVEKELSYTELPLHLEGIDSNAKTDDIVFEYGEQHFPKSESHADKSKDKDCKQEQRNVFAIPEENLCITIKNSPNLPEFRQSNNSRDFIEGDDQEEQQKFYIKMGTVLHQLFSTIHTKDDIEEALFRLELDGVLYDQNISRKNIDSMLRKRLTSRQVSDWFSDRWKIYNECSILEVGPDGKVKEHRPDRVMKDGKETIVVDFKFGSPRQEHKDQVAQYMNLLVHMGHKNVKGYLWYVYPNKIVEVNI